MKENIGKELRILSTYYPSSMGDKYGGQVGVIIKDDGDFYRVKMADGRELLPLKNNKGNNGKEWEWTLEPVVTKTLEEAIKELRGSNKVIHCSTQEEWDKVIQYAVNNSMKEGQGNWKSYQEESCIQIDSAGRQSYADRRYMRKENCEIITFKELIQSTTMDTKQTLQAQIEKMEQDILAMKKQVEAIDNPVYKVGDWVKIIQKGLKDTNKILKITEINPRKYEYHQITVTTDNCYNIPEQAVLATPEEIKAASNCKLPIGDSGKEVTITSSGIMAFDGTRINTDDLNEVIGQMKRSLDDINSWTVTVESVKIGCCEGCTLEQLESIYSKYQELKA